MLELMSPNGAEQVGEGSPEPESYLRTVAPQELPLQKLKDPFYKCVAAVYCAPTVCRPGPWRSFNSQPYSEAELLTLRLRKRKLRPGTWKDPPQDTRPGKGRGETELGSLTPEPGRKQGGGEVPVPKGDPITSRWDFRESLALWRPCMGCLPAQLTSR